ncbi:hypothetical protein DSO57_1035320 [Entomophthora muscae]|uniref:Uncharacterized protein n=1 Tax=Entomophthora muscae TaxID=34485 RepID=A0ACC2SC83_9FUNG|nr:hypothetical protein DSO57_1035320 [Entomophthora muscae]
MHSNQSSPKRGRSEAIEAATFKRFKPNHHILPHYVLYLNRRIHLLQQERSSIESRNQLLKLAIAVKKFYLNNPIPKQPHLL